MIERDANEKVYRQLSFMVIINIEFCLNLQICFWAATVVSVRNHNSSFVIRDCFWNNLSQTWCHHLFKSTYTYNSFTTCMRHSSCTECIPTCSIFYIFMSALKEPSCLSVTYCSSELWLFQTRIKSGELGLLNTWFYNRPLPATL